MMLAISSTSVIVIVLFFGLSTFNYVDGFINIICVLLLNNIHKKYYDTLCKICQNSMYNICYKLITKQKYSNKSRNENHSDVQLQSL